MSELGYREKMKKVWSRIRTQIGEWQENIEQDSSIVGMADFRLPHFKFSGKRECGVCMGWFWTFCPEKFLFYLLSCLFQNFELWMSCCSLFFSTGEMSIFFQFSVWWQIGLIIQILSNLSCGPWMCKCILYLILFTLRSY